MTESHEKILKNIFFSKNSYRHVDYNFDNPSDKFLTDTRKCSPQWSKLTEKMQFFQEIFVFKMLP